MKDSEKMGSQENPFKEKRKLVAIMLADIVGYTTMMSKDEKKALRLLQKSRSTQKSLIQQFNGEWLKDIGDATLSSFESAVEAVNCAVEIQRALKNDKDLKLRIGLHIGDVVFAGGDVFGDGVNIAYRIEPLAGPGNIYISKHVNDKIKNFPNIKTVSLGLKKLRNVEESLEVYQVLPEGVLPVKAMKKIAAKPSEPPNSVAVLPFANMSNNPKEEYFCDGMAEDIINALTHIEGLHVASRTSAFVFKGKHEDIREIGQKLNVGTLLEGSVRKAGNLLRITTQLVNVADGYHLWSERYDRDIGELCCPEDIFFIQDEIAKNIVKALKIKLSEKEKRALTKKPTEDIQAYDFYLRGREFFYQTKHRSINYARELFSQAIKRDPNYALAFAGMADCYSYLFLYFDNDKFNLKEALKASQKALRLDPDLAEAHAARGLAISLNKQYDEAEKEFERAIQLNPKLFEAYYFYARTCFVQGKLERAAKFYDRASIVNPYDYQSLLLASQIYLDLGKQGAAEAARRRGLQIVEERLKLNPDDVRAWYMGANALVALGQIEKGLVWANRALAVEPAESMTLYNLGCIKSLAGKVEEAIDHLEKAFEYGLHQKEWFEMDSNLDPLRSHPRFQALLKKL
jgi:adenylate cyclase